MDIPRAYSGIICDNENRVILCTPVEVACMAIEWEKTRLADEFPIRMQNDLNKKKKNTETRGKIFPD